MDTIEHILRLKLACLGDVSRYRIVVVLMRAPSLSVTGIAREVGLSQSCTTRHLQALRKVGVLERARAGKEVRFALRREDPDLLTLLGWMAATAPASLETPPIAPPRTDARDAAVLARGIQSGAFSPRPRTAAGRRVARKNRIADTAAPRRSSTPTGTAPSRLSTAGSPLSAAVPEGTAASTSEAAEPVSAPPLGPQRRYNDLEDFLL